MNEQNNKENIEKTNNKSWWRNCCVNKKIQICFLIIFLFILFICFIPINKHIDYKIGNYKITVHPYKIKLIKNNYQYSILKNGDIFLTGGLSNNENIPYTLNTTEIIDINKNHYEEGPLMNIPHVNHRQFNLESGNIVIADQNGFETFDYNDKKFYLWEGASLKKFLKLKDDDVITGISYVLLPNENILITGGYIPKEKKYLKTAFIADTKNKYIKQICNMPITKTNHISQVIDEKVYIFSGNSDSTNENRNKILVYDYEKDNFNISKIDFSSFSDMVCFLVKNENLCINYNRQFCEKAYIPFHYPISQDEKKYFVLNPKEEVVNSFQYPFKGLKVYNGLENRIGFELENGDLFLISNDCGRYKYIIYSFEQNKFYQVTIPKNLYGRIIKVSGNKALIDNDSKVIYILTLEKEG